VGHRASKPLSRWPTGANLLALWPTGA